MAGQTPLLLSAAFRPLFLCAGATAVIAMTRLIAMLAGHAPFPIVAPFAWHGHEMLFGYLAAAIAGFLLTAVPNWTNTPPVAGTPVAGLLGLWLLARIDLWDGSAAGWGTFADLAFLPGVAAIAAARIGRSGRVRQWLPVGAVLAIAAGNAAWHASHVWPALTTGRTVEVTALAIALLIAIIGGRITPAFTRNRLRQSGCEQLPRTDDARDWLALATSALVFVASAVVPGWSAPVAALAAVVHAGRLYGWCGSHVLGEPLLLILHIGYAWLAAGYAVYAAAALVPEWGDAFALHGLLAGAAGTMTLAVMSRATLGHTGRPLRAGPWLTIAFASIQIAALARLATPWLGSSAWMAAGLLWITGFAIFTGYCGAMLLRPRIAG